jgi:PAS domain S-box-containing protein
MDNADHFSNPLWTYAFLLNELKDIAVFSIDLDLKIIGWSPGVEHLLGYSQSDFIGQEAGLLFTPEDREQGIDRQEFKKALERGRSSDTRWHMRKDGRRIFVDGTVNAVHAADGSHLGYIKVVRDVFPDSRWQRVTATLFDGTSDAIAVKDHQGRFAFVNSALAHVFGKSAADVVGHKIGDLQPAQFADPIRQDDEACLRAGIQHVMEEVLLSADHGPRTFLSAKAPLRDIEGNIIGVVSISQDITPRKQREEERERLLRELRRSNEDLAQFSYVVSHDLQAPLRTIRSFSELLSRDCSESLGDNAKSFISTIVTSADNMQLIIDSLLRYAQAGEDPIGATLVDMNAVFAGAQLNLQAQIGEKAAQVTCSPLPKVRGDPAMLVQLLQNMIGNALKYSRTDAPPRIAVSARPIPGSAYEFTVQDNGVGISAKYFDLIFAPLKRLHGQEIAGTGIGLAICKKIVERHGGRIWVESQLGAGTAFHFTLPASQQV